MVYGMKFKTGRTALQVGALIGLIVSFILGVTELLGFGVGLGYSLISVIVMMMLSGVLALEVFVEGSNTGFLDRDYNFTEIISGGFAVAGIISSVFGLIGIATGSTLVSLPPMFKGVLYLLLAMFLGIEMVTE